MTTTPGESTAWFGPVAAAVLLTFVAMLLLAIANRGPSLEGPRQDNTVISMQSIRLPEASDQPQAAPGSPDLSSLMPTSAPMQLAQLSIKPQPLDINIDLSQMLQKRYTYRDIGAVRNLHGAFGVSTLNDVDDAVQNVIIPPNLFPTSLIDAGVYSGHVNVVIVVDERGRATVKRVLAASHPELVAPVVESINRAVYTIPTRNDKPTKVIITRSVIFNASEDRIRERRQLQLP